MEENITDDSQITRRGESIFYIGTFLFITGTILLIVGAASVIFFKVHYQTESEIILSIVSVIGSGLILISIGINCMIRQRKSGLIISSLGLFFTICSILVFLFNYRNNWYYPTISYVLILYILGLILLMGNAFGNVTLSLISSSKTEPRPSHQKPRYEYTDEDIEHDIEEAMNKSLLKAADELQFDIVTTKKLRVGNAGHGSETIVKVKDDMKETNNLNHTIYPGERENWGAPGIDKTSSQLADVLLEKSQMKKSFLEQFMNFFKTQKKS